MDSYELNKVLGALLGTCLALLSLNITASAIFSPSAPKKPGYEIAVPEKAAPTAPGPATPDEPIQTLLASADISRGEQASKQCLACHSLDKGGPNKVGPDLWGIVGRPKHSAPNFAYSAAMKSQGGNWTFEDLYNYLKNPRAMVPGTIMNFGGIASTKMRADLIAFLNTRSDNPEPLPKAAEAPATPAPAAAAQPPAAPPPAAPPPAATPPAATPPAAAPPAGEPTPAPAPATPGEPK